MQIRPSRWYGAPGVRVRLLRPELQPPPSPWSAMGADGAGGGGGGGAEEEEDEQPIETCCATISKLEFGGGASGAGLQSIVCELDNGGGETLAFPGPTISQHRRADPAAEPPPVGSSPTVASSPGLAAVGGSAPSHGADSRSPRAPLLRQSSKLSAQSMKSERSAGSGIRVVEEPLWPASSPQTVFGKRGSVRGRVPAERIDFSWRLAPTRRHEIEVEIAPSRVHPQGQQLLVVGQDEAFDGKLLHVASLGHELHPSLPPFSHQHKMGIELQSSSMPPSPRLFGVEVTSPERRAGSVVVVTAGDSLQFRVSRLAPSGSWLAECAHKGLDQHTLSWRLQRSAPTALLEASIKESASASAHDQDPRLLYGWDYRSGLLDLGAGAKALEGDGGEAGGGEAGDGEGGGGGGSEGGGGDAGGVRTMFTIDSVTSTGRFELSVILTHADHAYREQVGRWPPYPAIHSWALSP